MEDGVKSSCFIRVTVKFEVRLGDDERNELLLARVSARLRVRLRVRLRGRGGG